MADPAKKITRLRQIEADRVDGVDGPANGFPVLMMKQVLVNATGGNDLTPPSEPVISEEEQSLADYVLKRKISADKRKELATEGKALDDGSYPIENEEDLHNAAILARSGHGDVAAAKRLIARRAKELGVSNPLAEKEVAEPESPEAPEATEEVEKTEETPAPEEAPEDGLTKAVEDAIAKAVEDAIAKANAAHEAANKELRDELAVLKATPIPGGPAITAPQAALDEQKLAKRAYYERQAALTENDRELSKYYANKAAELA